MQLFLVRHWGTQDDGPKRMITDGLYAVRAANQEDCAQYLLRNEERHVHGQDAIDKLKDIREAVAKAKQLPLLGEFKHEKMVASFYQHWSDYI